MNITHELAASHVLADVIKNVLTRSDDNDGTIYTPGAFIISRCNSNWMFWGKKNLIHSSSSGETIYGFHGRGVLQRLHANMPSVAFGRPY